MFKTLKRWLGFKDKEESTMATKHPDGINVNPPAPPNIRPETPPPAPPPAPPTRSVRGDRRPPEPPPAPPVRTHHVTRSAPDPYYNTVLNNPILFVDVLAAMKPQQVDVTNAFKVTPYEAPAARQEPVRSPEPYFVEPDRSYNSSRDCGSSYDSSSSSSGSCSSSFD